MVLDRLPGLYGLKYDSATTCGLLLYLCSYKLDGSAIGQTSQADAGEQPPCGVRNLVVVGHDALGWLIQIGRQAN